MKATSFAGVMELVDVTDSKSVGSDTVWVRVPPPAPRRSKLCIACSDFFYKSQSALTPLLLLSKSNPLRWASIWFWVQTWKCGVYVLADGVYTLLSSAEGYVAASTMTAVIAGGSIANVTMSMTVDSRTYNGTVSGMIRDNTGAAVAGCFVGLYQVVTVAGVSQELLIATTKTNDAGKYLFGGVTGGEYLVKAKLEQ